MRRAAVTHTNGTQCKHGHAPIFYANNKCVECIKQGARRWSAANRDKRKIISKNWVLRNKQFVREHDRRYNGLPEPTRSCPSSCENCGDLSTTRGLALDHCKVTGKFRGWLCFNCNTSIGKLGDDIAGVQAALNYLKRAYGEAHV